MIADSYGLFTPGGPPPFDDFCSFVARTVAESFGLGVQLAAPFLVVSLAYNVGLGLLCRLMPQFPVFFVGLPLQVALQMLVMMLTISGIMLVFLEHFADVLAAFGGR